jgi:hypothetical protein
MNNTDTTTKRGRGRPKKGEGVKWNTVAFQFRNKTDKEMQAFIQNKMGETVSIPTIFRKRKAMIAAGKKVECQRPRYSRAK